MGDCYRFLGDAYLRDGIRQVAMPTSAAVAILRASWPNILNAFIASQTWRTCLRRWNITG